MTPDVNKDKKGQWQDLFEGEWYNVFSFTNSGEKEWFKEEAKQNK